MTGRSQSGPSSAASPSRPVRSIPAREGQGWAARLAGLCFAYPSPLPDGPAVPALRGIDLHIARGSFLALMGPVGAGKSTLCLALNGAIPHVVEGEFDGSVSVYGQETRSVSMGQLVAHVGLVLEDVEAQLFNASVADEVAFGLEGLGLPAAEIEDRLRSTLHVVGLAGMEQRVPRTLSGGQQKRLALASVLAMRPRLLVLDEPTSGLDPRGRHEVLAAIDRMRHSDERGMTVVMATQDAEAAARFADRVIVLMQGQVALEGSPQHVFSQVDRLDEWGIDVPQLARLAHRMGEASGRSLFFVDPQSAAQALSEIGSIPTAPPTGERKAGPSSIPPVEPRQENKSGVPVGGPFPSPVPANDEGDSHLRSPNGAGRGIHNIEVCGLHHQYAGTSEQALSGVDLAVRRGEWLAIVGVNGSGKSTLIKHLNGLLKPSLGRVLVEGQDTRTTRVGELARVVSYLPQDPGLLLFSATVRSEVGYGPRQLGLRGDALEARIAQTLSLLELSAYAEHPPAALGYGLRRQVALASVLAMQAPVLALDEPTVGLDHGTAERLLNVIAERHRQGATILMITHDLRWAARYAQRVAVLCSGHLLGCGPSREMLTNLDLLTAAGLDPLPVTLLAHLMQWAPPLPLRVDELLSRATRV